VHTYHGWPNWLDDVQLHAAAAVSMLRKPALNYGLAGGRNLTGPERNPKVLAAWRLELGALLASRVSQRDRQKRLWPDSFSEGLCK
jgi:hypothetical protein